MDQLPARMTPLEQTAYAAGLVNCRNQKPARLYPPNKGKFQKLSIFRRKQLKDLYQCGYNRAKEIFAT